ncbi:MAG: hypothetical protein ACJAZ0_003048 [Halioglobus sp.]|jgi:hypothetical protein
MSILARNYLRYCLPCLAASYIALAIPSAAGESFMANMTQAFADSDIVFERGESNAPFLPLAFLDASSYSDAEVGSDSRGQEINYKLDTYSGMAVAPYLVGSKDAVFGGLYASHSDFEVNAGLTEDFNVNTVGIPLGWLRQVDDNWQVGAFFMPMGHNSSLEGSDWTWQYLGGAFGRYVQNDTLWWAFGLYMDIAPGEDFFIPYVGASWDINNHWTLSAMMPWPAILYAPTPNWLVRLGASPSGASWSVSTDQREVAINVDAWDFGLTVERRFAGNLWASLEAGWGGFRGLRVNDSKLEEAEFDIGSSAYISIDFTFRPSIN